MKIYIASRTASWEEVQKLRDTARGYGHEITYDWTPAIAERGREQPTQDPEILEQAARADMGGVCFCEVFILLARPGMVGALAEFGMALAWAKRIWIVNAENVRFTIFFRMPKVVYKSYEQVVEELERVGKVP